MKIQSADHRDGRIVAFLGSRTGRMSEESVQRHKVMHVITGLHVGGAELMLARLATAMIPLGFDCEVVALMQGGAVASRFSDTGIPIHFLDMPQGRPSAAAAYRLVRIARAIQPDLIQGWMYHGNIAAMLAAWSRFGRVPVVWNVRHSLYDLLNESPLTRATIRLGARLSAKPAAIIYNSMTSARQHEGLGYVRSRTVVIPNGFDGERFRPRSEARESLRHRLGIPPDGILVGMVARNHPMKDAKNLLAAIELLTGAGVDTWLAFVGRGFEGITDAMEGARKPGRILTLGERDDVHCVLPAFDILALPSAWGEGFPNVIGEAMASEVPCVATDVGDSGWIIGEHGRLVPARDPAALAAALRELIELGPLGRRQLGQQGRARILREFELSAVARRYAGLYRQAIEGPLHES